MQCNFFEHTSVTVFLAQAKIVDKKPYSLQLFLPRELSTKFYNKLRDV